MGDSRRFVEFAQLIARQFPVSMYRLVADVTGELNLELSRFGYHVVSFDGQRRKNARRVNIRWRLFDQSIKDEFDLVVGMHPDEATDVIIAEAAKRKVPFAVVPCCVRPTVTEFKTGNSLAWYNHLARYAEGLGFNVGHFQLNISGHGRMLVGKQ